MKSLNTAQQFKMELAKSRNRLQYMKAYQSARTFNDERRLALNDINDSNAHMIILKDDTEEVEVSNEGAPNAQEGPQKRVSFSTNRRNTIVAPSLERTALVSFVESAKTTPRLSNDDERVEGTPPQPSELASNGHAETAMVGEISSHTISDSSPHPMTDDSAHTEGSTHSKGRKKLRRLSKKFSLKGISRRFTRRLSTGFEGGMGSVSEHDDAQQGCQRGSKFSRSTITRRKTM